MTKKQHWTQTPEGRERMRQFGRVGGSVSGPTKQWRNRKKARTVAASAVRRPHRRKTVPSHPASKPVSKHKTTLAPTGPFNAKDIQQTRFSLEDVTAALAFGRVSEILKSIARQVGVSEQTLAERVGALLRTS